MVLLVIFSEYIFYSVAIGLIAAVAVFETLRVIGAHKELWASAPAYLVACAFPILAYFVPTDKVVDFLLLIAATAFVYLVWLMAVGVFSKGRLAFSKIGEIFASVTYVSVSFTSLSLIRYMNPKIGVFLVVLVFVIAWVCDTAAFAVGSLMGKHKLIPEVSPKKTVEGAIGGVVFSAIFSLAYGFGLDFLVADIEVNYLVLAIFGAILSVVSQIGDLIASLVKREYNVKDYGRIFPGHGGVMDRFDSVIAVSTILMMLCIAFPPFA